MRRKEGERERERLQIIPRRIIPWDGVARTEEATSYRIAFIGVNFYISRDSGMSDRPSCHEIRNRVTKLNHDRSYRIYKVCPKSIRSLCISLP